MNSKRVVAVVLDWAGTTVDFGSLAPVRTLQRVFEEAGVPITEQEARQDMGIAKRDHIASLLAIARIEQQWSSQHGHAPSVADADALYQSFLPLQLACLTEYSNVIPGVLEVVSNLRARGMKIGSTTGYTRAMLDVLVEHASRAGYNPDCSFAPEDAGAGRPHPFMLYAAAIKMQVYPLAAIVKVGDTPSDIKEALNAGAWSVGVAATGNGIGLSEVDFAALPPAEKASRIDTARASLLSAGAHYVIDTLAELSSVIDDVEARLNGSGA